MLVTTQKHQRAKDILQKYSSLLPQEMQELKDKRIKDTAGLPPVPVCGEVALSQRSIFLLEEAFLRARSWKLPTEVVRSLAGLRSHLLHRRSVPFRRPSRRPGPPGCPAPRSGRRSPAPRRASFPSCHNKGAPAITHRDTSSPPAPGRHGRSPHR